MAIGTNKSDSTIEQLYSKLQQINEAKQPEQYAALSAEIERREAAGETLPTRPHRWRGEKTAAYVVVKILSILQYGALLLVGVGLPIVSFLWSRDPNSFISLILFYGTIIFLFLLAIGYRGMQWFLKSAPYEMAVKMWARVAMLLAPYTAVLYFYLGWTFLGFSPEARVLGSIILYFIGFYMPFVLITLWLRYKWREDEF
jgi:hypothetical protein